MFDDQETKSQSWLSAVLLVSNPSSTRIDEEENRIEDGSSILVGDRIGKEEGKLRWHLERTAKGLA
jgi:hypothetical protein